MADDEELERASFEPGWPDILPAGLIIARSTVTQLDAPEDSELPIEDEVAWTLHLGVRDHRPRLAMIADLTVKNPAAFGGVTVAMPFELRDEPAELSAEFRDGVLSQYGRWAALLIYDHAAMALRTALAGNGLPLDVPFETPEVEVHLTAQSAATSS